MSTNHLCKKFFVSDSAVAVFFICYTYFLSLTPVFCTFSHPYFPLYGVSFILLAYRLIFDCNYFKNRGNGYLLLFVGAFFISFIANGFHDFKNNFISLATIVINFFILYSGSDIRKKEELYKILKNLSRAGMIILAANSIISLALFLTDTSVLFWNQDGRPFFVGINTDEFRFTGLQGNPNIFGWVSLAGLACTILYHSFLTKARRSIKYTVTALTVLQVICVGLSLSRGAFFGLIVGFFAVSSYNVLNRHQGRVMKAVKIFAAGVFSILLVFAGSFIFSGAIELLNGAWIQLGVVPEDSVVNPDRMLQSGDEWSTGRTFLIEAGIGTLRDGNDFIWGVSPGCNIHRWTEYVDSAPKYNGVQSHKYVVSQGAGDMHNVFVQALYVMGILGLVTLLGFVFFIAKMLLRAFVFSKRELLKEDSKVLSAVLFGIFSIATVAMVDNMIIYGLGIYDVVFMLLCGVLVKLIPILYHDETIVHDKIDEMIRKPFILAENKARTAFKKKA